MNLKQKYFEEVRPKLKTELGLKNIMAVPKLVKIVVNVGAKEALDDKKVLEAISAQITAITGQKPVIRVAKKSVAAFKLREGQPIGVSVTLRGQRMYDFLEKIIAIVLPRVRDFHGLSKDSFDGHGNYSFGFSEQIVFPEIEYSQIDKIRGLEVTINTSAKDDTQGLKLLTALGFPFVKK